ncbi:MAG: hypothetical protein ACRYFX_18175 [Janthinobacterium lividum]
MNNSKKSGKLNMVGNMSRPLPAAPDPLDQLVYGSPTAATPVAAAEELPAVAAPAARRIIFTNQLTPVVYTQLRQYEYWGRKAIHEVLDEALSAFFADKPEARQQLPEKERAKLRGKLLE